MEKFFLCRFFACDELNIVHKQNIDRTIFGSKLLCGTIAYCVNNLICELLRRNIEDCQSRLYTLMPDSVQQVRFAQPDTAVEKQGIVGLTGSLCYCKRCGMRKAITVTDDKSIKGIAWIKTIVKQNVSTLLIVPYFI